MCASTNVARTYDGASRPASESLTIGGQTYTVAAAYGTTAPTITLTYPDGSVVVKTLNSRGLLHSVDRNGGDVVDRTYTDAGRLATQAFVSGVTETWTWRNDGMVNSIDNPAGLFSYSYDANKNRTAETITGALADASWTTGTTGFDDDDRLTYRNQGTGTLTEQWNLSLVGDWTSFTENGTSTARTHGPTHEILTVGSASLTLDSKGNLTTDEKGQLLAWDFDDQLVSVDTNADSNADVQYQYDALSRRVGRTEWDYTPTTPTSTTEVYPHWQNDIAADYPGGAVPTNPSRSYLHGLRIDELLAMIDRTGAGSTSAGADEPLYYHTDSVTSVRAISDANGDAVEYYRYGSYGEPKVLDDSLTALTDSAVANRYAFTAREWDIVTGLSAFRQRWHSSTIGRFLSRDPETYIDGASSYRSYFVPLVVDPYGLDSGSVCRPYLDVPPCPVRIAPGFPRASPPMPMPISPGPIGRPTPVSPGPIGRPTPSPKGIPTTWPVGPMPVVLPIGLGPLWDCPLPDGVYQETPEGLVLDACQPNPCSNNGGDNPPTSEPPSTRQPGQCWCCNITIAPITKGEPNDFAYHVDGCGWKDPVDCWTGGGLCCPFDYSNGDVLRHPRFDEDFPPPDGISPHDNIGMW